MIIKKKKCSTQKAIYAFFNYAVKIQFHHFEFVELFKEMVLFFKLSFIFFFANLVPAFLNTFLDDLSSADHCKRIFNETMPTANVEIQNGNENSDRTFEFLACIFKKH